MKSLLTATALGLISLSITAAAQQPGGANAPIYLPTPALPTTVYPGDGVEPEVTIKETDAEIVYEYRIKGRLYMVKIQPLSGPPYYLFDSNGDGQLDGEEETVGPNLSVPQWLLFSW